jgi:hypothetical protein
MIAGIGSGRRMATAAHTPARLPTARALPMRTRHAPPAPCGAAPPAGAMRVRSMARVAMLEPGAGRCAAARAAMARGWRHCTARLAMRWASIRGTRCLGMVSMMPATSITAAECEAERQGIATRIACAYRGLQRWRRYAPCNPIATGAHATASTSRRGAGPDPRGPLRAGRPRWRSRCTRVGRAQARGSRASCCCAASACWRARAAADRWQTGSARADPARQGLLADLVGPGRCGGAAEGPFRVRDCLARALRLGGTMEFAALPQLRRLQAAAGRRPLPARHAVRRSCRSSGAGAP